MTKQPELKMSAATDLLKSELEKRGMRVQIVEYKGRMSAHVRLDFSLEYSTDLPDNFTSGNALEFRRLICAIFVKSLSAEIKRITT